jgi:hypothetical protein
MAGKRKKIAVIITHGMGEQIPMETLRDFVDTAWVTDRDVQQARSDENPADIWIKPDAVTGSLELRRITTRWTKSAPGRDKGPRIDFFEFYWADLAEGTTVKEVHDWLGTLLFRWPSQVPKGLMLAWLALWTTTLVLAALSLFALLPWPGGVWHVALGMAAAAVAYLMQYVISPYIGDVARYVRADPRNIAMRRAIRERGLELLKKVHDSGAYERIVFVSHSLGTIVAYDLICLLWTTRERALTFSEDEPAFKRLRELEHAAHALANENSDAARTAYREAQREFRLALRSGGKDGSLRARTPDEEWLISDFVTLGSPLTHGEFLLARDPADLADKKARWLFPTNLPAFQKIESEQRAKINDRPAPPTEEILGPPEGLFSYYVARHTWAMHHATPFAAVRWTNIHDPHSMIFKGDIVSGPLAHVFGDGIRDIDLKLLHGRQSPGFSHTRYWTQPPKGEPAQHIDALRKAIDLLDRPDREIWPAAPAPGAPP